MVHEATVFVSAPPEVVFAIYRDVANWHTWDPDTKAAALEGPFAVGVRGQLTPSKGRAVPMQVVEVTENRSFTVECKVPLFCMWFEHELAPSSLGTQVTQRLRTTGLLGFLLNPIIGKQVREGFPKTLASLKRLAEQRHASAPVANAA